jgi:hypothetical protein
MRRWNFFLDWCRGWLKKEPGWPASLALHLVVLALLGSILLPREKPPDVLAAIVAKFDNGTEAVTIEGTDVAFDRILNPAGEPKTSSSVPESSSSVEPPALAPFADNVPVDPSLPVELPPEQTSEAGPPAANRPRSARPSRKKGTAGPVREANLAGLLDGRGEEARARLVKSGGGTKASEDAVELGLNWLARRQRTDGSWSFQHGPDDPGTLDCPTGATGLALLAFLGAGNTHIKGKYQSQVNLGISYLVGQMQVGAQGGWLMGTGQATMYVQGIGAIALCEAYTMTKDPALKAPAQAAIDFIVAAQDSDSGGWRYRIPQAGDTSVVGWQVMALQSARIAELKVPPRVMAGVSRFLKSVESGGGSLYGYTHSESIRQSTTAVGLLCRMYLGRDLSHRGLSRGIGNLSKWGPEVSDMYNSYNATQVMHHAGGAGWTKWNSRMRDDIVKAQARVGDSAGSWMTDRSHGSFKGGRLYTTCLSILTLEVYYRYLSLYRRPNAGETHSPEL